MYLGVYVRQMSCKYSGASSFAMKQGGKKQVSV